MTEPAGEEPVTCACGRPLRDPESVARRLGPVCWRKLHGRPARQSRRTGPATPGAGQAELPLADQLTLDDVDEWLDDDGQPPPNPDLRGQHATPKQLWTMNTIPTGSYL